METKTRKTTMIGAALAVAIIAMAGVGYAVVHYTATTTNTGNYMDSTYIELKQSGDAAYTQNFLTDIYFNSENTGSVSTSNNTTTINESTVYTPVCTHALANGAYSPDASGDYALISKLLTLEITPVGDNPGTVDLVVTASAATDFTLNGDLDFVMVLGSGSAAASGDITFTPLPTVGTAQFDIDDKTWSFSNIPVTPAANATSVTYQVLLFVTLSGTDTDTDDPSTGFPGEGTENNNNHCTFTFEITAPAADP